MRYNINSKLVMTRMKTRLISNPDEGWNFCDKSWRSVLKYLIDARGIVIAPIVTIVIPRTDERPCCVTTILPPDNTVNCFKKRENLTTTNPKAIKATLVLIHASKVRSFARWTLGSDRFSFSAGFINRSIRKTGDPNSLVVSQSRVSSNTAASQMPRCPWPTLWNHIYYACR